MKLRNHNQDEQPLLMIIPMIDIIFFLLVFFMMSMLTMVTQHTIALNLPKTQTAQMDTTETIPVSVNRSGEIFLEKQTVTLEVLAAQLKARKAKDPTKTLTVVLRGDQEAPYGRVIEVMDTIKTSGLTKVSIATETSKK